MVPHLAAAPMAAFSEVTGMGNRTGLDLLICCKIAMQLAIEASKMVMTTLGRGNRTGQRAPPSITLGTGNQTGYARMHKFDAYMVDTHAQMHNIYAKMHGAES